MSDKTAKEPITVTNQGGQTVLLVAAGQPIPDNLDELKRIHSRGPIDAQQPAQEKAVEEPAENKARGRAARK